VAVVEDLDEGKDLDAGLRVGGEVGSIDGLQLEGTPETLHGRVVIAVAAATHGGDQAGLGEGTAKVPGGILDAAIGMKEQARRGSAVEQGHGKGGKNELGVDGSAHGPTDDPAGMEVHDAGKIKPALPGWNVGDVGDPDLVGGGGCRSHCKEVGSNRVVMIAVGGLNAMAALLAALDALAAHEACNAIATVAASDGTKVEIDAGRAVGLSAFAMDGDDGLGQSDVFDGTRAR